MTNLHRFFLAALATASLHSIAPAQAWQPAPQPPQGPAYLQGRPRGSNAYECLRRNYPNWPNTKFSTDQWRWVEYQPGSSWNGACVSSQSPRG